IRKLGCPAPFATKGCAGSLRMGWGMGEPGTGSKKGPPPFSPTHPAKFEEKSGTCCCAGAIDVDAMRQERMLPKKTFRVEKNIIPLLNRVPSQRLHRVRPSRTT